MAERLDFVLRLIDKITGPAKRATKSLKGINTQLDKIERNTGFKLLAKTAVAARRPVTKVSDAVTKFSSGKILGGISSIADGLARMAKNAALVAGALAGIATAKVVKAVVDNIAFAERSRQALSNLLGSTTKGEKAFQTSIRLSKEFGLSIQDTTKKYTKLLAAQFTASRAEDLIKLTTDLKAIGASAQETESAIRAITQIKAKGRLQAEELVGQLAEAGIATTLVYDQLSKRLGVSTDKVRALITAGKISAEVGIDAIRDAILKKVGIKEAGEAGKKFAESTLSGMLQRLKAAPGNLALSIADVMGEGGQAATKNIVADILKSIESIRPAGVADFVTKVLGLIRDAIPLMKEFAAGFGEGFAAVLEGLGDTSDLEARKKLFRDLGKAMASLVSISLTLGGALAKVVTLFNTPSGRFAGGVGITAVALAKVAVIAPTLIKIFGELRSVWFVIGRVAFQLSGVFQVLWAGIQIGAQAIVPAVITAFKGMATAIGGSLVALGVLVVAATAGWTLAIVTWWDEIKELVAQIPSSFLELGANMAQGLIDGWKAIFGRFDIVEEIAGIVFKIEDFLGINSPSKLMMGIGDNMAKGMQQGMAGGGNANAPARFAGGAAASMAGGGGSRTMTLAPTINVTVGADAGASEGQEIAGSIETVVRGLFDDAVSALGAG